MTSRLIILFISLLALALGHVTPTNGLPMRKPSSRDDRKINHQVSQRDAQINRTRRQALERDARIKRRNRLDGYMRARTPSSITSLTNARKRKFKSKYNMPKEKSTMTDSKRRQDEADESKQAWKTKVAEKRQGFHQQIKSSEKKLERLNQDFYQYVVSRDQATEAEVRQGHTNRDAWADKYIEREAAKSNIRRHERVGNLLQHNPPLRQAFHEQADKLKAKPDRLEKEMANLKSEGKHDPDLVFKQYSQERQKQWQIHDEINEQAKLIRTNKGLIDLYRDQ